MMVSKAGPWLTDPLELCTVAGERCTKSQMSKMMVGKGNHPQNDLFQGGERIIIEPYRNTYTSSRSS